MFEEFEVIWLTGQPGAGKTSIGKLIHHHVITNGKRKAVILDGDDIRLLFENKDYSITGRRRNIDFVQKMVDFLIGNDILPIVSLVSPFKDLRETTKSMHKTLELYLKTDDIRGREHFHVEYYEPPADHYIELDTTNKSEKETFDYLLKKLKS